MKKNHLNTQQKVYYRKLSAAIRKLQFNCVNYSINSAYSYVKIIEEMGKDHIYRYKGGKPDYIKIKSAYDTAINQLKKRNWELTYDNIADTIAVWSENGNKDFLDDSNYQKIRQTYLNSLKTNMSFHETSTNDDDPVSVVDDNHHPSNEPIHKIAVEELEQMSEETEMDQTSMDLQ